MSSERVTTLSVELFLILKMVHGWDARLPNVMDEVGLYATAIAGGLAFLIIAAHLLLLLCLIIDSVSTGTIVIDRTKVRSSIPKIILDRVIQDEEYDDVSWDEIVEAEGIHAHDQLAPDARQEREESEINLLKEDQKSMKSL
ncbi:Protein of unknown function [Gryllus bimaculatus]|nr:Protein of unknown function [Gryllus bimaculatus]